MCIIMQKFVAIGQTVAEIWRFLFFKAAAVRYLGFLKIEILISCRLKKVKCIIIPNFVAIR